MAKIKRTVKEKICELEHDSERTCHWIIMRDDKKAVWGLPHDSKSSALAEISFKNLSGYHPEHRFDGRYIAKRDQG